MLNKKSPGLTGLIQSNSGGNENKDSTSLANIKAERTVFIPDSLDLNSIDFSPLPDVISDADLLADFATKITDLGGGAFAVGFYKFQIKRDKETVSTILRGIYKHAFLEIIEEYGYWKRYHENSNNYDFVLIENGIMEVVTVEQIKQRVHCAIMANDMPLEVEFQGVKSSWKHGSLLEIYSNNFHNVFNTNYLEHLRVSTIPIMRDSKKEAFFPFKNTVVKVNDVGYEIMPYAELNNLVVWKSHINKHEFHYKESTPENSHFHRFIHNVCNNDLERIVALYTAIGYMLHFHNSSALGQAVVLYDEEITDLNNPQGGTGKGVTIQALGHVREGVVISGKHFKENDKFSLQTVNETTQIVCIDDLNKSIPFEAFFSNLTDGLTIEQKFKPTRKLSPEKSPKFIFTSNSILGGGGSSTRRRQFIIEFSPHYSSQIVKGTEKPIIQEHGGELFGEHWTAGDWNVFFSLMVTCTSIYLANGLQPYELKSVEKNKLIQTVGEDFAHWIEEQEFQLKTAYETAVFFNDYKSANDPDNDKFKQRIFTNLLKKYAAIKNWKMVVYQEGRGTEKVSFFKFGI